MNREVSEIGVSGSDTSPARSGRGGQVRGGDARAMVRGGGSGAS